MRSLPGTDPTVYIRKVRAPIGVIGTFSNPARMLHAMRHLSKLNAVIFEAERSIHSNLAIAKALQEAVKKGLPAHAIQLVPTTDREAVRELCRMTDYLDLIIPRGGQLMPLLKWRLLLLLNIIKVFAIPISMLCRSKNGMGHCRCKMPTSRRM